MKKIIIYLTFIFVFSCVCSAQEMVVVEQWQPKLEQTLPSGWSISSVNENAVPYNLALLENEKAGISFKLTGPTMVFGQRGTNKENESFEIWIMSADYSGVGSQNQAPSAPAYLLGKNDEISVYVKSFVTDIPGWQNWAEDLIRLFGL